jgi:hypothetical protein
MPHMSEVEETFGIYTCNMFVKHMQHPYKTLATCNIKHLLQHKIEIAKTFRTYSYNICVKHMQHPNKHTCNICLKKEMKHLERMLQHTCTTIATCATSQSIFATSISNTCNIPLKHLKHTLAICAFNTTSPCCLAE